MIPALLALVLGLDPAPAAAPAILIPPWPISPDGETVAAVGGGELTAEGARLERLAPGLWRVFPRNGSRTVSFRTGTAQLQAAAESVPGRIEIASQPSTLVKKPGAGADLELTVLDAEGRPDTTAGEPVIACSAGTVVDLRSAGSGRFTARYVAPESRHPELAVITAIAPRCPLCPTPRALGTAVISLKAAIDLPGHTEPGVQMTVEIAGKRFGPVPANYRGRFRVPIVVPPGERYARGFAVDRVGNVTRTRIDLQLPPVHLLACTAWPRALPADGESQSEIICTASDVTGRPAQRAQLKASAGRGRVTGFEAAGRGLFRARYTAPRGGAGVPDRVVALFPGGGPASRQELEVALSSGVPAEVGYELEREPVPVGSTMPARTWARDLWGNPLGSPTAPAGASEGFVSADRFVARSTLGDGLQTAALRAALNPCSEIARLTLRRRDGEWLAQARCLDGGPAVGVTLLFGSGAEAVTDSRGEVRAPSRGDIETVRAANGARAAGFDDLEPPAEPIELTRTFAVLLRPPSAVDVLARLEKDKLRWRIEDKPGHALAGRKVRLEANGPNLGAIHPDADGGWCSVSGRGIVAVVDAETGVSAVVEVK